MLFQYVFVVLANSVSSYHCHVCVRVRVRVCVCDNVTARRMMS